MRFPTVASLRRRWSALWSTPATTHSPWRRESKPLRVGSVSFKEGTVLDSLSRQLMRPHGPRTSLQIGRTRWKRGTPMFHLYEALLLSGELEKWEIPIKWRGDSPIISLWKNIDQKFQKQSTWWLFILGLSLFMAVFGTKLLKGGEEHGRVDGDGAAAEKVAEKLAEDGDDDGVGFKWSVEVSI